MKRVFFNLLGAYFLVTVSFSTVFANQNGMMSTFGETTFQGMNGVMETYYSEESNPDENFNGIRTEIEPQHEKTAYGMNGVMDVFDPNTDALASATVVKKVIDIPALKLEFLYPVNGSELSSKDIQELQKSMEVLKKDQVKTIYLVGYADPSGSKSYNQLLSQKRADQAAKWLVNNGISSAKIKTTGAGVDHSHDDYQQARRVELTILFK